jgi:hypothetical protein
VLQKHGWLTLAGSDSMLGEAQRHAKLVRDLEPDVDSTAPSSDDHGNDDGGEDAEQPMQRYVIPRVGDDTSRKFPAPIVLVPERPPPAALPHSVRVEQARLDRIERDKAIPLPVALPHVTRVERARLYRDDAHL